MDWETVLFGKEENYASEGCETGKKTKGQLIRGGTTLKVEKKRVKKMEIGEKRGGAGIEGGATYQRETGRGRGDLKRGKKIGEKFDYGKSDPRDYPNSDKGRGGKKKITKKKKNGTSKKGRHQRDYTASLH